MQALKVLVPLAARRAVPSPESGAPRERDPAQQRVPETRTGRTRLSASRPSPIGGDPHHSGSNVGNASQARGAGSRGMLIAGQLTGRDRGRMKKHRIGALVAAAALTLTFAGSAFAADNSITWTGQGASNGSPKTNDCDGLKAGELLWILTDGTAENAYVTVDGAGHINGTDVGGSWHFVSPWLDPLDPGAHTVTVHYDGGSDKNAQFVLSHGCAAEETTTTTTDETTTEETTTDSTTDETTTDETTTEDTSTESTTDETTTDETTTDSTTTDSTTAETTTDSTTTDSTTNETTTDSTTNETTTASTTSDTTTTDEIPTTTDPPPAAPVEELTPPPTGPTAAP